jgi:hypothetical protein
MIAMSITLLGSIGLYLRHINHRRAAGKEDHRVAGLSREEIEELGEINPSYHYTY